MDKVTTLYEAHTNMGVDEALEVAGKVDLQDVIIIGHDQDGELVIRSSHMSRAEALFMLELAKKHALGD